MHSTTQHSASRIQRLLACCNHQQKASLSLSALHIDHDSHAINQSEAAPSSWRGVGSSSPAPRTTTKSSSQRADPSTNRSLSRAPLSDAHLGQRCDLRFRPLSRVSDLVRIVEILHDEEAVIVERGDLLVRQWSSGPASVVALCGMVHSDRPLFRRFDQSMRKGPGFAQGMLPRGCWHLVRWAKERQAARRKTTSSDGSEPTAHQPHQENRK